MVVRVQSMDPELNLSELSVCRAEQTPSSDKFVRAQLSVCQTKQTPSPDKFVRAQRLPSPRGSGRTFWPVLGEPSSDDFFPAFNMSCSHFFSVVNHCAVQCKIWTATGASRNKG